MTRQVLLVQGGGAGVHDEWDARLAAGLRRELGPGYEVRYPRMPAEDDPSLAGWGPVIRQELAGAAVVVGHSVGGTLLVQVLTEGPPLRGIVLIAAPFVGPGGWPGDPLPEDLGARLPHGVPVHVFHGLADETAPVTHADAWARVVPQAQVHRLPGRDHQLNDDLREVAATIRSLPEASR